MGMQKSAQIWYKSSENQPASQISPSLCQAGTVPWQEQGFCYYLLVCLAWFCLSILLCNVFSPRQQNPGKIQNSHPSQSDKTQHWPGHGNMVTFPFQVSINPDMFLSATRADQLPMSGNDPDSSHTKNPKCNHRERAELEPIWLSVACLTVSHSPLSYKTSTNKTQCEPFFLSLSEQQAVVGPQR